MNKLITILIVVIIVMAGTIGFLSRPYLVNNEGELNLGAGSIITLNNTASTTPQFLTSTNTSTTFTINSGSMYEIPLDIQVTASSSASVLKIYLETSEDGIDWFRGNPLALDNLEATTTPVTLISSTTPYYSWTMGTTETLRRHLTFNNINSSFTRFTFERASANSSVWVQVRKR